MLQTVETDEVIMLSARRLRPPRPSCQSAEAGFTLIEAIAAITVAAITLAAIAFAAISGIRASTAARVNQQAGDVIESTIEAARAQSYDNLAMSTSDPKLTVANDSRLSSSGCPSGASLCATVPNQTSSGTTKEALVTTSATGYITNHIQTVTSNTNNVPFTVSSYLTKPTDEAGASYKRLTVYASWTQYGSTHTRVASTYITSTKRGLPLPHFKLTAVTATSVTVNPGATVTFGFKLLNLGARDAWDFTSNNEALGWTYYLDDGDGVFDSTKDTVMSDSGGNGVRDTGAIEPNAFDTLWVTRTIAAGTASGSSTVVFTATSVAQPSLGAGTSTQTQSTTVTVSNTVITPTPTSTATVTPSASPTSTPASCDAVGTAAPTGTLYYLHNTTDGTAYAGSGSTALTPMTFSTNTSGLSTLYDYSTNDGKGSLAGRNLGTATPSFTNTNALQVAQFQRQVTSGKITLSGTTYVTVWAEPTSGLSTDTVTLRAMVGYGTTTGNGKNAVFGYTDKTASTATATGTGCSGWRKYTIAVPTTSFTASNNDYFEVLLFNAGTADVRIAYDTTTYTSNVVWQQS
jgi:type II secretory pathway pseudopilin PulG